MTVHRIEVQRALRICEQLQELRTLEVLVALRRCPTCGADEGERCGVGTRRRADWHSKRLDAAYRDYVSMSPLSWRRDLRIPAIREQTLNDMRRSRGVRLLIAWGLIDPIDVVP